MVVTDAVHVLLLQDSPDAGLTLQTGVEFPDAENRETVKRVAYPLGSEEASYWEGTGDCNCLGNIQIT